MLGHVQRGGSPSPIDRLLATRFGAAAVSAVAAGKSGMMVALKGNDIVTLPLDVACGKLKTVPLDSDILSCGRSLGVSFGEPQTEAA